MNCQDMLKVFLDSLTDNEEEAKLKPGIKSFIKLASLRRSGQGNRVG